MTFKNVISKLETFCGYWTKKFETGSRETAFSGNY